MSYRPPLRARRVEDGFYRIINLFENREWKQFARSDAGLKLPRHLIDDICLDYSNDVREQKYQMLSLWQRRNGEQATANRLNDIVRQYFESSIRQEQAPAPLCRQDNVSMANDDVESNQDQDIPPRNCSLNQPTGPPSIHSQYIHSDNDRWFNDSQSRSINQQDPSRPQSQYQILQTRPNEGAQGREEIPPSIQATSIQRSSDEITPENNCSGPRISSETAPKEVGTSTTEGEKLSIKNLQKAFHQHSLTGTNVNTNIQMSVTGEHAVGIQTIYYDNECQKREEKKQPETAEKLAEYCTKVTSSVVKHSNQKFYDNHLEMGLLIYKVNHITKGAVLLMNNSFPDQPNERHGSDSDLKVMDEMWKQMGCKTFQKINLTAADTFSTLQKFASSSHVYSSDFVAVVIMSHGHIENGEDIFYGADHKVVKIREVLDIFNNVNARRLQGIPKLFFLQMCRGSNVDKGAERNLPKENVQDLSDLFNSLEITVKEASGSSSNEDNADALGTSTERIPTMSDCLISYATLPGYRAFRNKQNGSWYINAIVNIFSRYAKDQHVVDLLTMVNAAVERKSAVSRLDELSNAKEMSNFHSTLTKKLYLFPGFPKEDDDF